MALRMISPPAVPAAPSSCTRRTASASPPSGTHRSRVAPGVSSPDDDVARRFLEDYRKTRTRRPRFAARRLLTCAVRRTAKPRTAGDRQDRHPECRLRDRRSGHRLRAHVRRRERAPCRPQEDPAAVDLQLCALPHGAGPAHDVRGRPAPRARAICSCSTASGPRRDASGRCRSRSSDRRFEVVKQRFRSALRTGVGALCFPPAAARF